jgi:hypothetical protein
MTTTPEAQDQAASSTDGVVLNLEAFRRETGSAAAQRENAQETQLRHELTLAFSDLGGATFVLAHLGALNDPRLASRVQRIENLYAQLAEYADVHRAA